MSKHNFRKAENLKSRARPHRDQDLPEQQSRKKQITAGTHKLSLLTFNPPSIQPLESHSEHRSAEEVFQLLCQTTRSKDEFISSLLAQNSELQHHIRFLEDLTAHFLRESQGPDRSAMLPTLVPVQPMPVEPVSSGRVQELEMKLKSISEEWEREQGRLHVEMAFRDAEIERLKNTAPGPRTEPKALMPMIRRKSRSLKRSLEKNGKQK